MLDTSMRELAAKHGLTVASGMAYGMLNGCYVTFSESAEARRISIYVGPQEAPAPGFADSVTVSCAKQLIHTVSTASGPENIYGLLTGNASVPALILNHAGSVVTVNFSDAPEAAKGLERFIDELLPQAAPLTRPHLCIYCGAVTQGKGCPVRLSADTVVPMHHACLKQASGHHTTPKQERIGLTKSILAAAAGALIGMAAWVFLSGYGPLAWLVGVLMGLLPVLAYDLVRGKPGRTRFITVIACAAAAVVLGSFGACIWSLHQSYVAAGQVAREITSEFSFMKAQFQYDPTELSRLITALVAGAFFAGIGCLALLRRTAEATAEAARPRRVKGQC